MNSSVSISARPSALQGPETQPSLIFRCRGRSSYTTDSYVVTPRVSSGGNIGDLAVNGTVNDLAVAGAEPFFLSTGFIIEKGFPLTDLKTIIASMSEAAQKAAVKIVPGDTKVMRTRERPTEYSSIRRVSG